MDMTKFNDVVTLCRSIVTSGKTVAKDGLSVKIETDPEDGLDAICISLGDDHSSASYELSLYNRTLWKIVRSSDDTSSSEGGVWLDGLHDDISDQALDQLLTRLHAAEWI